MISAENGGISINMHAVTRIAPKASDSPLAEPSDEQANNAPGVHTFMDDAGNLSARLRELLRSHPKSQPLEIHFQPKTYHFYPDDAEELFCFVANNDSGLRRIAFALTELRDVLLDGHGATFLFHGRICPFLLRQCKRVVIRNLRIDFVRPSLSQAEILEADASAITVRLDERYPYELAAGQLWFTGDEYESRGCSDGPRAKRGSYVRALEFDAKRREPAFMAQDHSWLSTAHVEETAPRTLRFHTAYPEPRAKPGNWLVLMHDRREMFGFCLDRSADVTLENTTLHHAGAMGIIAQHSTNVRLDRVRVIPDAAQDRVFSTYADAAHLVCCAGRIELKHCCFEGMMDDPLNVHGIYTPVACVVDTHHLDVQTGHYQQAGVCPLVPGPATVIDPQTLLSKAQVDIESVEAINSNRWRIRLASSPPCPIQPGDCLEALHWRPDLYVTGCDMGRNRARGLLISTAGSVLIENNRFHHAGSAIKISGDARSWFESGAVRDVLIRNNQFESCGYGPWGRGIIAIDPEIERQSFRSEKYHRNIRIEGNHFTTFHRDLLYARCTDGLSFINNTAISSHEYPANLDTGPWFELENCSNTTVQPPAIAKSIIPPKT